MVLALLIAAVVTGLAGVAYLPGVLFAVAIGIAVAAVVTARRSRSM
jgi:energy-converting hydrogenase Eha subunit G